jgi:ADP-ribosylglycohydrolase
MTEQSQRRIVNSAVWAAWADAIGFMSELTDITGLRKRVHADKVSAPIEWHRLVGGRYGAYVKLPAGCYSDDTQLRLSTSRAIRGNGYFDVESFAKIELPVWLCYSLGAGVGTKAAALNLTGTSVSWFSNFYVGKERSYVDSGGNGAAMRVQPHVWAAKQRRDCRSYLTDVVRNSVCTHGSLRAVVGAAVHAIVLARTIESGKIQMADDVHEALQDARLIGEIVFADRELSSFWLPVWEQKTGKSFPAEVNQVLEECTRDIATLTEHRIADRETYRVAVESVGGLDPTSRGSGTKTSLIAAALCWGYHTRPPSEAITVAANLLGSDTDTIGTLAGAILGAVTDVKPVGPLLDQEYIEREAMRLHGISLGSETKSFAYPDLMRWSPPKNQTSAVGLSDNHIVVTGLGPALAMGDSFRGQSHERAIWRWLRLEFGQTIIAKMRSDLQQLPHQLATAMAQTESKVTAMTFKPQQNPLFSPEAEPRTDSRNSFDKHTLDEMTSVAIKSGFDPATIGQHIIELSSEADGIERCLGYVAIIGKARRARMTHRRP